jgi:hypothetical protein
MKGKFARYGSLGLLAALMVVGLAFAAPGKLWSGFAGLPQHPIDPNLITGEFDPSDTRGRYLGEAVTSSRLPDLPLAVLGHSTLPKRIEVDLTRQRVYAFEGDQKVYEFVVSTGKWGRTPTGTFTIWGKFKYTKMSGGNPAIGTYYYLPNVPYVMFFSNNEVAASRGFSLHGTYWHTNFGQPMSHGCINMRTEDARTLFYWSSPSVNSENYIRANQEDPGTEVIIYGTTPRT